VDDIRNKLVEHFAKGYQPGGQDEVEADAILPLVLDMLATVWEQGYYRAATFNFPLDMDVRNPYRAS
jgi:hypothetical protein